MGKFIGNLLAALSFLVFIYAVYVLLTMKAEAGLVITEENDVFLPGSLHSDRYYTQGTDIGWQFNNNSLIGLRERMYTPRSITSPDRQVLDRPWAATLSTYFEYWDITVVDTIKYGFEIGVMGPNADGECFQSTIHRWIGSPQPKGWFRQMPNEPVLQLYGEYWIPLAFIGTPKSWAGQVYLPVGYNIGTTYINISGGLALAAGWNPRITTMDISIPKLDRNSSKGFCCFTVSSRCYYVAHNATLGHSFFYSNDERWIRDAWEVDIKPAVLEGRIGIIAGYGYFSTGYYIESRTKEFETQGQAANWATLRFGIGTEF